MPKLTKENKTELTKKLEYIGIDLDNIPDIIKSAEPLEYRQAQAFDEREHRVYKYVPINQIQILVTTKARGDEFKEKYKEASPIYTYLEPKEDESINKYSAFLSMLNLCDEKGISQVEEEQALLQSTIPFNVKYKGSYIWDIYYSETTKQYFMLVSSDNQTYNEMFYLLKKQFEYGDKKRGTIPTIFVPINLLNYTEETLSRQEIADVENYLWLFTGNWATIYEVFNKEDKPEVHILGETNVYENIKSKYRVILKTKEEATRFYNKVKALFILQTELTNYYKFTTKIGNDNTIRFFNSTDLNKEISYNGLSDFIKSEYEKLLKGVKNQDKEIKELKEELLDLKKAAIKKEQEYLQKQREISTYLEYKKTFFGRVRYFFKAKKKMQEEIKIKEQTEEQIDDGVNIDIIEVLEKEKELYNLYTIENLLTVYTLYKKQLTYIKNMNLDINGIRIRIENIEAKLKNSIVYINEINNHKKSIFEFWKFANKDERLALDQGQCDESAVKEKVKAVFNLETDMEDLGIRNG